VLDASFAALATARANTEANLRSAREVFQSHLQSVFHQPGERWHKRRLVDLCDAERGITYGVIKLGTEVSEGVPCLRTSNVRWLRIETDGMKRIARALSDQYSRTILRGGEVLVNVRGTLGGVAVVPSEMAGWNVSREVAVVPVDTSRALPAFVAYLIGSGMSQDWLDENKKGATYVGINLEDLRLLPVVTPGLDDQSSVVQNLRAMDDETTRLESKYRTKLVMLEDLKQSLLHAAFSGAL
jgi:type I restriction enzyme S subunit